MTFLLTQAQLTRLDNQKVGRQGFATEAEAAAAAERIASAKLRVALLSSKVGSLLILTSWAHPLHAHCLEFNRQL